MQIHFTSREAELLHAVAKAASVLDIPAFAVGGFVRDKILERPTKDIDIVCMGDGMELAQQFAKLFKPLPPVSLFKTCLLYTSPSPRDTERSRMPSSA